MARNLIDNARSFSPPGGEVRVALRRQKREALVQIDDDGPGIPPENLETIFQRFYTARPKGAAFGGNSGLGLAIARHIVEAHGGKIWAENRLDEGRIMRRAVHSLVAAGMILHAGLVALRSAGFWCRGAHRRRLRGHGKSDLALRALGAGFTLVADDRVVIFASSGRLYGRAPTPLSGLIEVRGVGVLARQPLSFARVVVRVTRSLRGRTTKSGCPSPPWRAWRGSPSRPSACGPSPHRLPPSWLR